MTKCDYDLKVVNSDKDEHELENTGSPYRSELIEHSNLIVHDFLNYKTNEFGEHIDPDNNFYNKIINECEYYTEEQSNNINMEGAFSLIHFNSRSLYKNFEDIKECLSKINKFSVIAVSETWLDADKACEVELEGYELFTKNRINKKGGGVALYVDNDLSCKIVDSLSTTTEGVLECLSVEITVLKSKNIIVSSLYRTPGSCLDLFNKNADNLFGNLNKMHIVCGDFNINLLNPHNNMKTSDFITTMYSNNLFPLITKPTRITADTATLIDNIFTNRPETQITAGLLINDITDHLPVFSIFHKLLNRATISKVDQIKIIRYRTPETMTALKTDLFNQTWDKVYATSDPDKAYDIFLSTLLSLYDKHCPLKEYSTKDRTNLEKPWITKGIANACKKKKYLHKLFIKHRTKEAEDKYKSYKNKLINIIRSNRHLYYHNMLEQHKNNIQSTWKVLNSIIKKQTNKNDYPNYFVKDGQILNGNKEMSMAFNNFFANVGPSLANEIPQPSDVKEIDKNIIKGNVNSLFLRSVDENEIIQIVSKLKNKRSTDCFEFDTIVVKEIIYSIVAPLVYIFNQSFLTGIFPSKMKTAKVVPIFKNGDKHQFTNYRPISLLPQFSKILEKLYVIRLDDYLNKFNLISDYQFGFRSNRATELVEEISTAIDNGEYTVGVFIDLSKAFDTIDHNQLLAKVE